MRPAGRLSKAPGKMLTVMQAGSRRHGYGLLRVKKAPWMPEYSIYFVDSSRQVMRAPQVENLVDDSAALMRAAQLTSGTSATEVWCGHRLVCSVPSRASATPRRDYLERRAGLAALVAADVLLISLSVWL